MSTNANVVLNFGQLPPSYKPDNWQGLLNDIAKVTTGYLPGNYNLVNYGSNTPSAEDQDKPWIRTNVDGSPDRVYVYFNGNWVAPHPVQPSQAHLRWLWVGSVVALRSFDGGDGSSDAPTPTTGAMWEVDTAVDAKFLCTPGTFATAGELAVNSSLTATGVAGADEHTLAVSETPAHTHKCVDSTTILTSDSGTEMEPDSVIAISRHAGSTTTRNYILRKGDGPPDTGVTTSSGGGDPHNNLPPMYGIYLIKRTARTYYVAS
jgi:hypothetical protein